MATAVKVIAIGNSAGIILPKETLARLNVQKGDTLYITEGPQGIRLCRSIRSLPADGSCARSDAREPRCSAKARGVNEPVWIRPETVLAMHEELLMLARWPGGHS